MKKVLVFGATGRTGAHLLDLALQGARATWRVVAETRLRGCDVDTRLAFGGSIAGVLLS
jgi:uncharacterized protein YbjT (DUF2867 family)